MKKIKSLVLCALIATAVPAYAAAYTSGTISVTGTGEYAAAPDMAVLNFQAAADAMTAADARAAVENTVSSFMQQLSSLNLPPDAVKAENLLVSPRFDYQEGSSKPAGYRASRLICVTLYDFAAIGEVTDLALQSGISGVAGFTYQLQDRRAAEKKARELAMADAQAKAQELADGFAVELGTPVSLSFEQEAAISPRPMALSARADNAAGAAAFYRIDDITVRAQVNAVYNFRAPEAEPKD